MNGREYSGSFKPKWKSNPTVFALSLDASYICIHHLCRFLHSDTHIHTHTHSRCTQAHTYTNAHTHTHIYTHTHVHTGAHTLMQAHTHTHTDKHVQLPHTSLSLSLTHTPRYKLQTALRWVSVATDSQSNSIRQAFQRTGGKSLPPTPYIQTLITPPHLTLCHIHPLCILHLLLPPPPSPNLHFFRN